MAFHGLKKHVEGDTVWLPLAVVAREFRRPRQTMITWCKTGFIFSIGYRAKRDPKGHWYLSAISGNSESSNL